VIHAEVISNNGEVATAQSTSITTKECGYPNGVSITVTNGDAGTITLGGGSGSAEMTFEEDIPLAGLFGCHLSGTLGITYTSGTDEVTVGGETPNLVGGFTDSAGCPNAGLLEGSFAVTDSAGSPVAID
jgi:hypothetical protein